MLRNKLFFVLLWIALQLISMDTLAADEGGVAAGSESDKKSAPSLLNAKCILVPGNLFSFEHTKSNDNTVNPLGTGQIQSEQYKSCKDYGPDNKWLKGTGDVIIGVKKNMFEPFQKSVQENRGQFILFINGVPLSTDATLLTLEEVNSLIFLRLRLHQGPEIQKLWSILYADGALYRPIKLHATLGWRSAESAAITLIPIRSDSTAEISLTTFLRLWISILLVLLSIGIIIWVGRKTDVLRDTSNSQIPQWWEDAEKLKAALKGKDQVDCDAYLKLQNLNYDPQLNPMYELLAKRALQGLPVKDTDATKIGLALLKARWNPVQGTYSLGRTQMALWFTFAVATGIFLWMLYGELRPIDNSLLALLGISSTTATVSWLANHNSEDNRVYYPSRGFFHDLITGFDERKQLHRYQAVVVNILLLFVGVFHVVKLLNYPTFDTTWLIFLGISGTTYGIGKQILETKNG